jgi:hypothetical protein
MGIIVLALANIVNTFAGKKHGGKTEYHTNMTREVTLMYFRKQL